MASKKKSSSVGVSRLWEILSRITRELDQEKVPYMLIGGLAVLRYGEPRFTKDVDLTVGLDEREATRVLAAMKRAGLSCIAERPEQLVMRSFFLPFVEDSTRITIDVAFGRTVFEVEALAKSKTVRINGESVRVCSPEHLIVHKIIASRPRDLDDVRGILAKNPKLNLDEVRRWLRPFEDELGGDMVENFETMVRDVQRVRRQGTKLR